MEKLTFVLETNLLVISIVLSARNLTGTLVVVLEQTTGSAPNK